MFDKKCKFKCKIEVVALSQTPYLCGNIYCTLKLQNGGKFARNTEQKSINNHEVIWSEAFDFLFEALLDKKTRILKPSILKISVKMVSNKQKDVKLGFVPLNLSEFSGFGVHTLRFHLKGHNNTEALDNSILQLKVDTNMLQGGVIFKPSKEKTENRIQDFEHYKYFGDFEQESIEPSSNTTWSIKPTIEILSPVSIPTRTSLKLNNDENLYSPWFKGNRSLSDEILFTNVRGSPRITLTRVDNDQITDEILSKTFLCMEPGDSSQLDLFITTDGKTVLGQAISTTMSLQDFKH